MTRKYLLGVMLLFLAALLVPACGGEMPPAIEDFTGFPSADDGPGELPGGFGTLTQGVAPTEAPVLVGPTGTSSDTTPLFQWDPIAGGAYWYYIWVNDAFGGTPIKKLIREIDAGCAGGTGDCSWESTALNPGTYRFYIVGLDDAYAAGPWSTGMSFTISTAPADAPVLVAPSGYTTRTPTYQWQPITGGAYAYYVWVNDAFGGTPVKQLVLEGDAGCAGGTGTCSYVSPQLAVGNYRFYVRGQDSAGNPGPWSNGMSFSATQSGGAVATNLLPVGTSYNTPYYRWTPPAGGADEYQIWVNDGYGGTPVKQFVTQEEVGCDEGVGTCSWIGPPMAYGWYKFYIRTRESGVYGPWSTGSLFRITSTCTPGTCSTFGYNCDTPDNGCGDPIANGCGTCTNPETCGGGGTQYVCGQPATCSDNIQNQGETGIDCGGPCPACSSYLFFSEYIEGSSNNKAVEIYNTHSAAINLSICSVRIFFNGSGSPGSTIALSGTIASHGTSVLCNNSSVPALLAKCNQTSGSLTFNGDDAVQLWCDGTTSVDVIGQIGMDPGNEWGTGLTSTADNTILRNCSVTAGDPNGADAFDPSIEWTGYATDTFDYLGSHCP